MAEGQFGEVLGTAPYDVGILGGGEYYITPKTWVLFPIFARQQRISFSKYGTVKEDKFGTYGGRTSDTNIDKQATSSTKGKNSDENGHWCKTPD